MITKTQVQEIESRLAGSGEMGGGDAPQPFLIPILDRIYDEGSNTLKEAADTAQVTSERARILKLRNEHGGFLGFIRGLLDLMEYRGLAIKDSDVDIWRCGSAMVEGEKVMIVSGKQKVSYTARTAEQRAQRDNDSREQGNIAALAASLMPNALGLRRVTAERLARINKSIDDNGFRDTSPIIIDDLDRVIAGRHRLEIERTRYNGAEKWRRQHEKALSAYDAVQMAMASNEASPWDKKDYERLDKLGVQGTKSQRLNQKIELALLENACRPNIALAELLDCAKETVKAVRSRLEERGEIRPHRFMSGGGVPGRRGPGRSAVDVAGKEEPERARDKIAHAVCEAGARGLTCDEVEVITGLSHQGCSARLGELAEEGRLKRTNEKRETRRGPGAHIYVVATEVTDGTHVAKGRIVAPPRSSLARPFSRAQRKGCRHETTRRTR